MENRKIIANCVMAKDGTIIQSMHRHDYKTYTNDDGTVVVADGGKDYLKRALEGIDVSVYEDDHFEVIRRFFCRGGRGIDGTESLTYTPLFKMNDNWLEAVIEYNPNNYYNKFFQMEIDYRKENGIKIE